MALIDRQYLARPYYGLAPAWRPWLATQGHPVNRKRVQRLMRLIGLGGGLSSGRTRAKPAGPRTRVYPYLLGWGCRSIGSSTRFLVLGHHLYPRWPRGFLYLVAIMDWHSRAVTGLAAVEHARRRFLRRGGSRKRSLALVGRRSSTPTRASQFTSDDFTRRAEPGTRSTIRHGWQGGAAWTTSSSSGLWRQSQIRGGLPACLWHRRRG